MHEHASHATIIRNMLLILLAGAAGSMDAISYVSLGQVFTAAMTGNTVLLGLAIGQLEPQAIYFSGAALVGFIMGTAVGVWICGTPNQQAIWSGRMTVTIMVEAAVLVGVLVCWSVVGEPLSQAFWQPALIVATAVAMGMQSAAVHHLSLAGISTTYITSTITNIVARLVAGISTPHQAAQAHYSNAWLLFAVWLVYLGSAAGTAALITWAHIWTMLLPIALVIITIGTAISYYHGANNTYA